MSELATVIKEEVSRLGRKEAKASTGPLKRRILALEKLVREQRLALKQLAQRVASASRAAVRKGGEATEPSAADGARLTPRSIRPYGSACTFRRQSSRSSRASRTPRCTCGSRGRRVRAEGVAKRS